MLCHKLSNTVIEWIIIYRNFPPTELVWGLFPRVKRSEHKADHLPLSSAEVKNDWNSNPHPAFAFMAWAGKPLLLKIIKLSSFVILEERFLTIIFHWLKCRVAQNIFYCLNAQPVDIMYYQRLYLQELRKYTASLWAENGTQISRPGRSDDHLTATFDRTTTTGY